MRCRPQVVNHAGVGIAPEGSRAVESAVRAKDYSGGGTASIRTPDTASGESVQHLKVKAAVFVRYFESRPETGAAAAVRRPEEISSPVDAQADLGRRPVLSASEVVQDSKCLSLRRLCDERRQRKHNSDG